MKAQLTLWDFSQLDPVAHQPATSEEKTGPLPSQESMVDHLPADMHPTPEAKVNRIGKHTFVRQGQKSCISHAPSGHGYEVFLIKYRKARVVKGVSLPASLFYPPNSAWGHWAWSYRSFERALAKFNELENENPDA